MKQLIGDMSSEHWARYILFARKYLQNFVDKTKIRNIIH